MDILPFWDPQIYQDSSERKKVFHQRNFILSLNISKILKYLI